MQQRNCVVCGKPFEARLQSQRACPPNAAERARAAKVGRQPRSRCGRRVLNHTQRESQGVVTIALDAPFVREYHCEWCGKRCETGVNVAPQSTMFCAGQDCKREWHRHGKSNAARAQVLAERQRRALARFKPSKRDETKLRRTIRRDPCAYCGGPAEALDHIEPKQSGGSDSLENRTAACRSCNSLKGTQPLLLSLLWIPVATDYHRQRRLLFSTGG